MSSFFVPCTLESIIAHPPGSVRVDRCGADSMELHVAMIGTEIAFTFPAGSTRPQVDGWLRRHGYKPDKAVDEFSLKS